ncbi:phosphotransferase [Streptomyces sp. NPDC047718]|uniref:phosphotransferase n=1 Tax=Streptomyces sp. NPDC047718 TaxID=3155479 RepID=UPI003402733A
MVSLPNGPYAGDPPPRRERYALPVDVHLILRRDGGKGPEVLLSRRAGPVYASGLWHLPSGHLDGPHEDVVEGVIREAAEETGVVIDRADVALATTVHHRSPHGRARVGLFFEVRRFGGEPAVREPAVCDAMGWYPLDALPDPMVAYCRAGLDAYRAGHPGAVHFQQPGDPVPHQEGDGRQRARTRLLPGPSPVDGPPRALLAFAERGVGRVAAAEDASWARQGSDVWRLTGAAGGTWYLKRHAGARAHQREVTAYRQWVPALGGRAPQLVAADEDLRAIVVTAVPGSPLHGAPGPDRGLLRAIGALTAAFHAAAPPRPPAARPSPAAGTWERHLDAALPHLAPGDAAFVRATAERLAGLAPLGLVPTHGDLHLRNLLRSEDGALAVIDFERSAYAPAVRDWVRLWDAWAHRPDLHEAFREGYGRPLTGLEEEHLAAEAVLDAVSGIAYGTAQGDPEVVERGRRTLLRLRAAPRGAAAD